MTDHGPRVIIAGTREDWPGGVRTLIPREPTREPNGTLWFGAEIRPHGEAAPGRDPDARRLARRQPGPPGKPRRGGARPEARRL